MNNATRRYSRLFSGALCAAALTAIVALGVSCNKNRAATQAAAAAAPAGTVSATAKAANGNHQVLTATLTVAMLRNAADGHSVKAMFNENAQILTVTNEAYIAALKDALAAGKPVQVTFDPWGAVIVSVSQAAATQAAATQRTINNIPGTAKKIDLATMAPDAINDPAAMAIMNSTDPGLNNVIPDMQTAQMMFDYITHQCCANPGPYAVDHCITFQYCPDGCYARAHKMCWIINNRYKYGTKKIFSFANAGSDELCVKAEKWGGCCINWWYHVAPLVTVKTAAGPKAYVFDPAMFDQPVLLSVWLHAQENPACVPSGDVPHVSMINIQPTSSYWPSGGSGMLFETDPTYSSTNSTLVSYQHLISCP